MFTNFITLFLTFNFSIILIVFTQLAICKCHIVFRCQMAAAIFFFLVCFHFNTVNHFLLTSWQLKASASNCHKIIFLFPNSMTSIISFRPKPWKVTIINGYIRQQNKYRQYSIPQIIQFLITKYFDLDEKFEQLGTLMCNIINNGLKIKAQSGINQAIGTIPFHTNTHTTYKWTFHIESYNNTYWSNISFGIKDQFDYLKMYYNAYGEKHIIQGDYDHKTQRYGEEFGENDVINMELTQNYLSFKKNGKNLGVAFDKIFKPYQYCESNMIFVKLYCFISLNQGAQINLLDFQIV